MTRGDERHVHIINPFWGLGGSERRALALFEALRRRCAVSLWSDCDVHPQLREAYPIRKLAARRLRFPKTGTLVFVGAYFYVGKWVYLALPHRTILVYNTPTPEVFSARLQRLSLRGWREVEVVYASEWLKRETGHPGVVEPSLVDVEEFRPGPAGSGTPPFTVGRLSRDVPEKHHPGDLAIYRRLAERGCRVRVLGGTCLREAGDVAGEVSLLHVGAEEPVAFLQDLDCLFYRTSPDWTEPFGRVVMEAMACGLPVVCEKRGGYVDVIEHGQNGFLFETDEEGLSLLLQLKEDVALRDTVGKAARRTMERMYGPAGRAEIASFYLK